MEDRSFHLYKDHLIPKARSLRQDSTFPERLLWSRLRRRQLGFRFLRQHPIDALIVDFYCPEARLAIEIDGHSHDGRFEYDSQRQAALELQSILVVRFSNDEVLTDIDGVVARLRAWLEENISRDSSGS